MVAIYVLVFVVIIAIVFLVWWFNADTKAKRKIKNTPVVSVADIQEGTLVKVVGAVDCASEPMQAPLSGRACTFFRIKVSEYRRRGKNSSWVTIIDDTDGIEFIVSDSTGGAFVDPSLVRAVLDQDAKFNSGLMSGAGENLEAYLSAHGRSSKGIVFNKSMKYHEGIVEPGEVVAVVGIAHWDTAGRDRVLRIKAPDDGPVLLTDMPKYTRSG